MSTRLVYALSLDGTTYRYVGMTKQPLENRLAGHRSTARNGADWPVCRWFRKHGLDSVQATVLEECESVHVAGERECYWISRLRREGYSLLNVAVGGSAGDEFSAEARKNMSKAAKVRIYQSRPPMPDHVKQGLLAINKGRRQTAAERAMRSAIAEQKRLSGYQAPLGRPDVATADLLAARAQGRTYRSIGDELGMTESSVWFRLRDVVLPPDPEDEAIRELVVDQYTRGYSMSELNRTHGLTRRAIRKLVHEAGVPIRVNQKRPLSSNLSGGAE